MSVRYVAFDKLANMPHIIVDSGATSHTTLTLSHWPGVKTSQILKSNLSAGIVIKYLKLQCLKPEIPIVSTSHFDIDGLIAVYGLINPEQVLKHWRLWLDVASAGDFKYSQSSIARQLATVCEYWASPEYSPLGNKVFDQPSERVTEILFYDLLPRLDEICRNIQKYKTLWEETETAYTNTWKMLKSGLIRIEEYNNQELSIIHLSDSLINSLANKYQSRYFGLSAYALHEAAQNFTLLICLGHRYQIVQRYETWVQYFSRSIRLRRDFAALVKLFNSLEGDKWHYDGVWMLTPMMSLLSQQESQLGKIKIISLVSSFLELAPSAWNPYAYENESNVKK